MIKPEETTSQKIIYIQKVRIKNREITSLQNKTYQASKKVFCKNNKRKPNSKAKKKSQIRKQQIKAKLLKMQ